MGIGSSELSCPRCMALCKTSGLGCFALIVIIIISMFTFGIGLIIGLLYYLVVKKRPVECSNCGFRWQP